jgi:aminoglycoside 6'-N-acetyltransferase
LQSWHRKPHILAVIGDFSEVDWEAELAISPDWRELLIAECGGRPIGVVQIIDPAREASHYWGEVAADLRAIDIWIGEEADLGRGHGTRMMSLALDRCFAEAAVTAVLIDPLADNMRARRFYQKLGFQAVGPRMFGADACMVYRLDREMWHAAKSRL